MVGEPSPIRAGVSDYKDDDRDIGVAGLQADPAIESLSIEETCLGLNPDDIRAKAALAVPGSEIAADRHRHFSSPAYGGRKQSAKAAEELELARVPNRIPIRIRARCQPQPNGSASRCK